MDLTCRCMGADHRTPCPRKAASEDGRCEPCRENDCENTPLARFMDRTDVLNRDLSNKDWQIEFEKALEDYIRECAEKGVQP